MRDVPESLCCNRRVQMQLLQVEKQGTFCLHLARVIVCVKSVQSTSCYYTKWGKVGMDSGLPIARNVS